MSPEQARGRVVDRRADIWAFGVVLYEMLFGERPFGGDEVTEVLASQTPTPPLPFRFPIDTPDASMDAPIRASSLDPLVALRAE